MGGTNFGKPLLPDYPPLLHKGSYGPHTIYESDTLPKCMARSNGQWCIADFQLNKQLYKGKASTLYLATCRQSGTVVALKSYSKRRLSDLNWFQVEREIRLHSQLRHPNILQLHAAFEDDNYVFFVTEFAAGGDLYEYLKRCGGQLKEREVAGEVLPPFMSALIHMHSHSIIHRDIKPENILLGEGRVVKVADFGLSINWEEERPVTRAGTLDYMSPEVLQCPEKMQPEENKEKVELGYTDAVDVWAVGILAYELLVGRPPFERETREETYQYIQRREPVMPSWLTEHARDFILTALRKSARKRPTMSELMQHPWIQLHCRTSAHTASPPTHGLHLALHDRGSPTLRELHRPSLHGAQSSRDLTSLLQSALSATSPMLSAAAAAATATVPRPPTATSRLAPATACARPGTPSAALLGAGAAAHAPLTAAAPLPVPGSAAGRGLGSHGATFGSSSSSSSSRHPVSDKGSQQSPVTPTSGLLSTCTSSQPLVGGPSPAQDLSLVSALSSSSAISTDPTSPSSGPSVGHSPATLKLLSSSFILPQTSPASPAATGGQPSAFLELYKSMAPPPPERLAPALSPRPQSMSRKGSASASRPGGSSSSSSKSFEASLPPLQPQLQELGSGSLSASLVKLPSVHKIPSQPLLSAEASPAPLSALQEPSETMQPAETGLEHAVLAPIPEQQSSEREGSSVAGASVQLDAGHLLQAAHSMDQKAGQASEDGGDGGSGSIPAVYPGSLLPPQQSLSPAQLSPAAAEGQEDEDEAELARRTAQQVAHDRMREAEQKHIEKLRARAASRTAAAAAAGGSSQSRQGPAPHASSSLAKSASSLLNKLLGRKAAGSGPAAQPGRTQSSNGRAVQRSDSSGTSASSGSVAGPAGGKASGSPKASKFSVPKSEPATVHIHARAGGGSGMRSMHASPQRPAQPQKSSGSGNSLVHRTGLGQHKQVQPATQLPSKAAPAPASLRRSPARAAQQAGHIVSPAKSASLQGSAQAATQGATGRTAAPGARPPASALLAVASEDSIEGVESRTNSKSVRFAGLASAGPSGNLGAQDGDLIKAFSPSPEPSGASGGSLYTSAVSSLPSIASGASTTSLISRKGSLSPPVSRKGSLAAMSSRGSAVAPRGSSSLAPRAGKPGGRSLYKMSSMPGDRQARGSAAVTVEAEDSGDAAAVSGVQRSAASWSHPASASSKVAALRAKSTASAARLAMYTAMLGSGSGKEGHGPPGSGSSSAGRPHKPGVVLGRTPVAASGSKR